jgi:hypothetical protein
VSEERITPGDIAGAWASARVTDLLADFPEDTDVPAYGAAAWLQLSADDPRRPAAVLAAAEEWRQQAGRRARIEAGDLPAFWEVFGEAAEEAQRTARRLELSRQPSYAELEQRRGTRREATPVKAAPGWPVAIPGRPGWWRHCIDSKQVDLLGRHPNYQTTEHGAAA